MDDNSTFPMSPASLSPKQDDIVINKKKNKRMSAKEKENSKKETAAFKRNNHVHIEPAVPKTLRMSELLLKLKHPTKDQKNIRSSSNEEAAKSSSINDSSEQLQPKTTQPSSGLKHSSSSIQFSTPPSSPIKSSVLQTNKTPPKGEHRIFLDDIEDDYNKENNGETLEDLGDMVNANAKKRREKERREKIFKYQVKPTHHSDTDSDTGLAFDDCPSSPLRQSRSNSLSPTISPKKLSIAPKIKNTLLRSNSDFTRAGKANNFDHRNNAKRNPVGREELLGFLRNKASEQAKDMNTQNRKSWVARGGREKVNQQETLETTQQTSSSILQQKLEHANKSKNDLDDLDDDESDEDWNEENGSETDRGSADEDEDEQNRSGEEEYGDETEGDMGSMGSADEQNKNENDPQQQHTSSEGENEGDKENNANILNHYESEDDDLNFPSSRRKPMFLLDGESKESKSPSQPRPPLAEIGKPQDFCADDAPALHMNRSNDSDEDLGFSQFFNDEFSQEVGGDRFKREGFEKTEVNEGNMLLPAIDQLPKIMPNEGAAHEDLALLNQLSFAGQGTQQEPEFRQYVNAQGMLTQTKPTDLFAMSPGASQLTQLAHSISTNSPSQNSPTNGMTQRRQLVQRTSTQLASLIEDDETDENASPTQLESQSSILRNKDAFSALFEGRDKHAKESSPITKRQKRSVFIDEQADESEDENTYKLGVSISKNDSGDDDEDDENEDDNVSLDGLVDNAPIKEELEAEQNALLKEIARVHEQEDDMRDLKLHQDVVDGKARRRRQGSLGVLSDDDYDDDDTFGNASKSKARKRKVALQANNTLEHIAKDPKKKAFADAITISETGAENDEWLMGGVQEQQQDEDDEDDDRAYKRRKSRGREVLEYDQYSSDHSIDLNDLGEDEEVESDEEPTPQMPMTSSSPQPGYKVHNQRKQKLSSPTKQFDDLDSFYDVRDSQNTRMQILGGETEENSRSNARAVGKGGSITGLSKNTSSGGKKNEVKLKSAAATKKATSSGITRKSSVLGQKRNIR